jgi:hypothetical protein
MDFLYAVGPAPSLRPSANTLLLIFDVCESILFFRALNNMNRQMSCYAATQNSRDA